MAERQRTTDKAAAPTRVESGDPTPLGATLGNTQLGSTETNAIPAGDTAAPAPAPGDGNDALATVPTKRYGGAIPDVGTLAPDTLYRSNDGGEVVTELEPGTAGYVVVAKGDTVTPLVHRDLAGE